MTAALPNIPFCEIEVYLHHVIKDFKANWRKFMSEVQHIFLVCMGVNMHVSKTTYFYKEKNQPLMYLLNYFTFGLLILKT